ncbi:hypothetical protein Vafri_8513 [Volvox africanus]|nr:hypothetical protein Vafri_8513 [Volvox africanus]
MFTSSCITGVLRDAYGNVHSRPDTPAPTSVAGVRPLRPLGPSAAPRVRSEGRKAGRHEAQYPIAIKAGKQDRPGYTVCTQLHEAGSCERQRGDFEFGAAGMGRNGD